MAAKNPKCISRVESCLNGKMELRSSREDYSKAQNTFKSDAKTRSEN